MCRRGAAGLVPSPAAPESWGAVAGRQEEQEASEQLSRLGLTLHFPHDALGPPLAGVKAHPPWGGPGEGGVPRVPPLSAPGALYLRCFCLVHTLWPVEAQISAPGVRPSEEPRIQEPTGRPVCSEAASPLPPEIRALRGLYLSLGPAHPQLDPDPARLGPIQRPIQPMTFRWVRVAGGLTRGSRLDRGCSGPGGQTPGTWRLPVHMREAWARA